MMATTTTTTASTPKTAMELLNAAISELEARLNFPESKVQTTTSATETTSTLASTIPIANSTSVKSNNTKSKSDGKKEDNSKKKVDDSTNDVPDICKLEFKVGVITKVWVHESADKLYCEEIDVGEDSPRQIASGLRQHFTMEQMLGQRLLVVANLKPKNLVGFKSHGMVLCASKPNESTTSNDTDGNNIVEFVEPPIDAQIGEMITFNGLPHPTPVAPNVIEKKKIFALAATGMNTNEDGIANWNGHIFMTSTGPCRTRTIVNGILR
jgi:aminoacyl tRNA synthase complex-interacting multifunctional protein 1